MNLAGRPLRHFLGWQVLGGSGRLLPSIGRESAVRDRGGRREAGWAGGRRTERRASSRGAAPEHVLKPSAALSWAALGGVRAVTNRPTLPFGG